MNTFKFLTPILFGLLCATAAMAGDSTSFARPAPDISGMQSTTGTGLSAVLSPLEGKQITCKVQSCWFNGTNCTYVNYGAAKVVNGKLYTLAYASQSSASGANTGWIPGKVASYSTINHGDGSVTTATADATGLNVSVKNCNTCDFDYCSMECSINENACTMTWPES